ncbi:MAG: hypothetical protein JWQ78_1040, partial [Sediminibacterium sp.]|nr:hypothetical protein [Sediminibacterium sp.]
VIEIPGREKITKDLPAIYREGYVMSVETGNPLQLIVNVATNLLSAGEVYLVAHTRQSVKATMKASFKDGKAIFNIPKTILGDGISHMTVFNNARQPVCERLYFKYPENKLLIKVDGARPDYSTRSNIRFGITSMDALDKQKSADLSMAVYRVDSLQSPDEVDINNYLLLTSELKGYVESPGYYFRDEEAGSKAAAVDNLMLTQGWRRFNWNDILQDKTPVFSFAPEYNGHLVTGRVTHSITGAPMENMETYLSIPGAKAGFFTSTSDGAGKIKYEIKNMQGSAEIIVQPDVIWDSVARIEIANPFSETYTNDSLPAFRLFSRIGNTLLDQSIATQVQNIYTGDKLKQFALFTDSTAFFEKPDGVYFLDDYTRFTTMEEVLREYVTFMDVRKRNGHFGLALLDMSTDNLFDLDPLMLVDGVPVFSADKLLRFDPTKIRKLEVVNRRYFLGNTFFNGIMNFRSYKGDVANAELNPHATVLDYEGLQLTREFYSPAYDTQEKLTGRLPDFRNVLYWTPDIRTNGKDSRQVSFYSSDRKGRYVAVIQGLSKDGNAGSGMVMFEVK